MKCPICEMQMEKGHLVINEGRFGTDSIWYPETEAKKKWMKKLQREGAVILKHPVEYRVWSGEIHYEAFYCRDCNKVIAFFDAE